MVGGSGLSSRGYGCKGSLVFLENYMMICSLPYPSQMLWRTLTLALGCQSKLECNTRTVMSTTVLIAPESYKVGEMNKATFP